MTTLTRTLIVVGILSAGCATVRPIVPESPGRTEAPAVSCWEAGKTKQPRPEDSAGCRVQAWLGEFVSGLRWDDTGIDGGQWLRGQIRGR